MAESARATTQEQIVRLSLAHRLREGLFSETSRRTRIGAVDTEIFRRRVAPDCMAFCCSFRAKPDAVVLDACCSWGVDADASERERIERARKRIAPHLDRGAPDAPWFRERPVHDDDFPSGVAFSTRVRGGACVFLRRDGRRGCGLHAAAIAQGLEPVRLKPMFCSLFPLLIERGVLTHVRADLDELSCSTRGPSVYRVQRPALESLFGASLVAEIDELERAIAGADAA